MRSFDWIPVTGFRLKDCRNDGVRGLAIMTTGNSCHNDGRRFLPESLKVIRIGMTRRRLAVVMICGSIGLVRNKPRPDGKTLKPFAGKGFTPFWADSLSIIVFMNSCTSFIRMSTFSVIAGFANSVAWTERPKQSSN